jgi:hypothetical protein
MINYSEPENTILHFISFEKDGDASRLCRIVHGPRSRTRFGICGYAARVGLIIFVKRGNLLFGLRWAEKALPHLAPRFRLPHKNSAEAHPIDKY